MPSMSLSEYLSHILDETEYITRASKGLSKQRFMTDETLKRAFVRSIEIIGEAVKRLPDEFRSEHSAIDWRAVHEDVLVEPGDAVGERRHLLQQRRPEQIPELRRF